MFSLNEASILGNVTRDPETKTTPAGTMIVVFSVATSQRWKDKDTSEMKERSEFHNCVAFGSLAQIISTHVHKGTKMYVEGRLQTRSWDNPEGKKQYRTEVVAEEVIILGEKTAKTADESAPAAPTTAPVSDDINIEDIDFGA